MFLIQLLFRRTRHFSTSVSLGAIFVPFLEILDQLRDAKVLIVELDKADVVGPDVEEK